MTITMHQSPKAHVTASLESSPHVYLQPNEPLNLSALELAKSFLDPIATAVSKRQAQRLRDERISRKRKRNEHSRDDDQRPLQLEEVFVNGFSSGQVWEQVKRVTLATRIEAERGITEEAITKTSSKKTSGKTNENTFGNGVASEDLNSEASSIGDDNGDLENGFDYEEEELAEVSEDFDDEEDEPDVNGTHVNGDLELFDGEHSEEENENDEEISAETFIEDPNGLNDGFFSIDDFNKRTEFLERQDATGDAFDGQASDEEDIDWDANPLAMASASKTNGHSAKAHNTNGDDELGNSDSDEDDDSEDGPTFGDADLNGVSEDDADASGHEDFGVEQSAMMPALENTNDILYADFFEPPPRKLSKGDRQRDFKARQNTKAGASTDDPEDINRTMEAVRRDLFEDDASANSDDSANENLSDLDPSDPKSRRSTHERRQAKLAAEIRKLEAANVAKRDWTLQGEARAADRPLNSLLEEDLDFERQGKPVPVITAAVSEDIEALIKRRILAHDFDELIRRRPGPANGPATRRGRAELPDTKDPNSLADLYEQDHLRAANPDTYTSKADAALTAAQDEVKTLWRDIESRLDALASFHFRPAAPEAKVTVVAATPTIAMEDARPAAAGVEGLGGAESRLAPQEVYVPGSGGGEKGERVGKSGVPVARGEMGRNERVRRRRREKERLRKRLGNEVDGKTGGGGMEESGAGKEGKGRDGGRKEVIEELKRAGVGVIGKKGEITDVEGNQQKENGGASRGGKYKL